MSSASKWGEAVGEGAGAVSGQSRYAKYLDLSGIAFAPPGVLVIARPLYDDEGTLIAQGYSGGVALAQRQIAHAQALGVLGRIWGFEGFNECWADDPAWLALVMQAARGYVTTIQAAGKVAIAFSIQVGNGLSRTERQARRTTPASSWRALPTTEAEWQAHDAATRAALVTVAGDFQYLFSVGAHVAYHSYWGPPGPEDNWLSFAGRYQAFASWLRAAGVTATQRWALTEGGYEYLWQYQGAAPVHPVSLSEATKIAAYVTAARLYDADPLVSLWTPFTYWHRTQEWRSYDLAVKLNGQPWTPMLSAQAAYLQSPGPVIDPPGGLGGPPPAGNFYIVTASPYLNLRAGPGTTFTDIGNLPLGTVVEVLSNPDLPIVSRLAPDAPADAKLDTTGWYRIRIRPIIQHPGYPDTQILIEGYAASQWLRGLTPP